MKFTNYDYVSPNIRGTIVTATHLKPTIVLFVKRNIYHKSKAYRIIKDWRVAHNAQRLLVDGWRSLQFLSGLHISPRLNNSCYRSISTDRVHRSFTSSTFTTTFHEIVTLHVLGLKFTPDERTINIYRNVNCHLYYCTDTK